MTASNGWIGSLSATCSNGTNLSTLTYGFQPPPDEPCPSDVDEPTIVPLTNEEGEFTYRSAYYLAQQCKPEPQCSILDSHAEQLCPGSVDVFPLYATASMAMPSPNFVPLHVVPRPDLCSSYIEDHACRPSTCMMTRKEHGDVDVKPQE